MKPTIKAIVKHLAEDPEIDEQDELITLSFKNKPEGGDILLENPIIHATLPLQAVKEVFQAILEGLEEAGAIQEYRDEHGNLLQ